MPEHTFTPGDTVICDPAETPPRLHGVVYTIDRFGPVNAILSRVGGGQGLRIHPSSLLPAPTGGTTTTVSVVDLPPAPLTLGAAVTVSSPSWKGGTGLHVVLADHGTTVKLVALGGNNHRYWPTVPRVWLTEVDRDALLTAVAGLTGDAGGSR
jgi:hypothetical protein